MRGTYYRWTKNKAEDCAPLTADILGNEIEIQARPLDGTITVMVPAHPIDVDTARMIGVRLIEAAALADDGRSVREP